jgi:hypothetical protein
MNAIKRLESMGYRFELAIEYACPHAPPPEAAALLSELAARKPEALLYLAEWSQRPAHIRTSEQYRAAINKGVSAGRDPRELLLLAVECIADMTGNTVFYAQNAKNIKAVYGELGEIS